LPTGDARFDQDPAFNDWVQGAVETGLARRGLMLAAARSQNVDTLSSIVDNLTSTCEGCHAEFKPDLPTEEVVHMPPVLNHWEERVRGDGVSESGHNRQRH
jgi:hypothetical protein